MKLSIEQVSKRHRRPGGAEKVALDEVSLTLNQGEIVGIFGPSGSGKTTLLRIAAGLERPDSGSVRWAGERVVEMSQGERDRMRRQDLGCVWGRQEWPVGLSVLDQVRMPLLADKRGLRSATKRTHEALLVCEVEQCAAMHFEDLSDGERQRVAIARALVIEPRILLADGPASHLSLEEQEDVMSLLAVLAREGKMGVLVTENNDNTLMRADRLLYLCDGRLVTPEPRGEQAAVLDFPTARSRRAAADA